MNGSTSPRPSILFPHARGDRAPDRRAVLQATGAPPVRRAGGVSKSAPSLQFIPDPDLPEMAFAGRSNVGKSSLLNALTGRKSIARTSVTPGRTQELNFFEVGEPARAAAGRYARLWLCQGPAQGGRELAAAGARFPARPRCAQAPLVLVDSRHGVKPVDGTALATLDKAAVNYQVGADQDRRGKPAYLRTPLAATRAATLHPAAYPEVVLTSSRTDAGIAELRGDRTPAQGARRGLGVPRIRDMIRGCPHGNRFPSFPGNMR